MDTPRTPLVIGHRGASGYRPEHTRAAYELAFALGADAVEPDIVATSDGVLVLRHENEISGTTDVASHPEFADRRTTKTIDGASLTGWFTEDFTWSELKTLRAIERLPALRQHSASFDGAYPILRLCDLRDIIVDAGHRLGREFVMVAEIKHATYFESIGLPLDALFAAEVADWATATNLVVESFEESVLGKLKVRGVAGRYVYLVDAAGAPADLVAKDGAAAASYAAHLTDDGLAALAKTVDGVSLDKKLVLDGRAGLVDRIHTAGLIVFTWTLRAENKFLAKTNRGGGAPGDFGNWRAEFTAIIDTGIDGVFADQPDLVRSALEAH
ncbi:MAG: glycerophosphodiester phosphodiesterase family protein [Rhodoglobus sp.]